VTSISPAPVHLAAAPSPVHTDTITPGPATVGDVMGPPPPRVAAGTIVDAALDLLSDTASEHLTVVAPDGACVGMVTRADFAPYRKRSWYTQRTPIRNIAHTRAPFARPDMPIVEAVHAMRARGLRAWPVVDTLGRIVGVLTPAGLRAAAVVSRTAIPA